MTIAPDILATCESKSLQRMTDRRTDGSLNLARRDLPDSLEKRAVRLTVTTIIAQQVKWVQGVVKAGTLNKAAARETMLARFLIALELGHAVAGVPNVKPTTLEIASIASLCETELEFLEGFLKADEAMGKAQRSALYGKAVLAAFYRGWVAMLPTTARIHWRLSISEHCSKGNADAPGGCLGLELASPYTKPGTGDNQLPTLPGNGDTACLGNCECYLEADGPSQFASTLAPQTVIEVTESGGKKVFPTSANGRAWSQQYQDLAERITFFTRLASLDKERKAEFTQLLDLAKDDVDRVSRRLGQKVRFGLTNDELMAPVSRAQANGLTYVPAADLSDDLLDVIVWVLAADYALQGKVVKVFTAAETGGPAVQLDRDDTPYRLDGQGRYILFR